MKPLTIAAYFDGRLGHEKQTRGILRALAAITSTKVTARKTEVSPAASCRNWAAYYLPWLRNYDADAYSGPVDLIIGTGTHTHIPMLLEKETRTKFFKEKVPVVTCMDPDRLLRGKFDLCCIPTHDDPPARENIFVTLGPPCPVLPENRHDPDRGLILIGGLDKKSHTWNAAALVERIGSIIRKDPSRQWMVSSSPRTPAETCGDLENLAASSRQFTFYRSEDTPPGWIEEQYALHPVVWVTADSVSMVYEALSGGCSVGILPVEWLRPDNKFQKSLAMLHEKKMIVYFNEWLDGAELPVLPEPLHEAERCAREILRRWWPERLP